MSHVKTWTLFGMNGMLSRLIECGKKDSVLTILIELQKVVGDYGKGQQG